MPYSDKKFVRDSIDRKRNWVPTHIHYTGTKYCPMSCIHLDLGG